MPILRQDEKTVTLPQITQLNDPVAAGLFTAYQESSTSVNLIYTVADRHYIGRVVEIPARYGRDQLLGIIVPLGRSCHACGSPSVRGPAA